MIKRICIFIISLITLFSLIACEKNNEIIIPNDGSVEVFYMNRGTIENDDIKLNLKRTKCEKLKKFVLSIEIDLKNKTNKIFVN